LPLPDVSPLSAAPPNSGRSSFLSRALAYATRSRVRASGKNHDF